MQWSKETFVRLFYNVSSSCLILFLFFYFTSLLLAKLLHFFGTPILQRYPDGYDFAMFSEEEEEEEEESGHFHNVYKERGHQLVADIIDGGESLQFWPKRNRPKVVSFGEDVERHFDPKYYDEATEEDFRSLASETELDGDDEEVEEEEEEEILGKGDVDYIIINNIGNSAKNDSAGGSRSPVVRVENPSDLVTKFEGKCKNTKEKFEKARTEFTMDEKFLSFTPLKPEAKKIQAQGKDHVIDYEEIFGDSCTVGSTSKSSSEWRSSINCRDSGTEDPFSSSSRRSCPKWESYTVFQKYDEEMLFLDRISAQKLHETESLRAIEASPRSVSERIVYKLSTRGKSSKVTGRNPYNELEAAYVAQICLTWEALNWNYEYFQRLRASRRDSDPGCPAYIAQHFQQFQVLLQRYVENEPYEHGRRPEIYARMRSVAPKLLQVPEYRDSIDEDKQESLGSRISSDSFLQIMEESIRTFMNFLKADRESHYRRLAAFFGRNQRGSVDPTRLLLLKKLNKQKKLKLKDLRRSRKCLRRRRLLKDEEEMEILMALIDTKVVSRVMRMADLTEEQLQWCDDKMRKVRVGDGKLQRDSSPLFFPAH